MFSVISYDKASPRSLRIAAGSMAGLVVSKYVHYGFVYDASELTVTQYRDSLKTSHRFQHLGKSMTNCSHLKGNGQFLPISPAIKRLVQDQNYYTIFTAFGTDAEHTIPYSMHVDPKRIYTFHLKSSSFPYIVGYSFREGKRTYVNRWRYELIESFADYDECEGIYETGYLDDLRVLMTRTFEFRKRPKVRVITRDFPDRVIDKLTKEYSIDDSDLMYSVQTQAALQLTQKPQNAAMAVMRLKELVSGEFIESLAETYAKTSLKSAKSVANTYLSTRYGLKLSVSSMQTYFNELGSLLTSSGYNRSGGAKGSRSYPSYDGNPIDVTYSYSLKCAQPSSPFVELAYKLRSHGFVFTLQDAWDFIPYSFVLDWTMAISEYLDILDSSLFLDKHPILGSVETFKVTQDIQPIEFGLGPEYCGVGRITRFRRQCGSKEPTALFPPPLQALTAKNYLDGSMLVIQRAF